MTQFGMDRSTGLRQSGWDNVIQAIEILLTTRYFERCLREYVGSPVPALLGELANVQTVIRFQWSVAAVILLFEPRFTPTRISPLTLDRTGASDWVIEGIYRPRAHLGDITPAGTVSLRLGQAGGQLIVTG
ncbi:Baseplate protein [Mesorhizobium plurifarium]|uniref:Baseplate protein n=1 Tax=Mesorhizobium plurifarium TaxID=69974 RepID=A0A090G429_MESPL|nr:Baseplate protein [Mesorhizobium plurifarium]